MVETQRSSAENLSTSNEAIYWTEHNQNSKLNQIKWLLENSDNENIKNLMNLIKSKDYKKLQKEIWCTTLDGKLWAKSLEKAQLYVNKEKSVDTVKTETKAQVDDIKESLAAQMQQPGEIWNTNDLYEIWKDQQFTWNFENASKQEMWSGEWILDKWERKLKKWVDIQWNKLKLEKINIPTFDRSNGVVLREETSKTLNNISIKYIWKNICINDEYVIHPQWTICSYNERKFLDTYAQSGTSFYQDTLLKPLYNYLDKNRSKFEKQEYRQEYRYVSEPIVADGRWNNPVKFDNDSSDRDGSVAADRRWNTPRQSTAPESIPSNIEWKSVSLTYENVPMLDEDLVREYGLVESLQTKKQLRINKIWKVWKEIYINQQFKVVPKRNNRWEKYYTIWQNIWWKYHEMDSSELSRGSYRWTIYEDLNRKYFS